MVFKMKTLLISKDEAASIINIKDVIPAVEKGYMMFNEGKVILPPYMGLNMPDCPGGIDFKAGYCAENELISLKASSGGFVDNPVKYNLPANLGTVLLFDSKTCALLCVMDGSLITGYRTGAAGAVSIKYLARKDAHEVASIGTGNQARMQLRASVNVADIRKIHCWDSIEENAVKFKNDIENELKIPVVIEKSKKEAVEKADIVISTTRGTGPVIEADWVKPGTHIVAVGTDEKGKQEYEPEIFLKATAVCDSIKQCVEKGEIQHAINKGYIAQSDIYAEIGQIISGEKKGRTSDEQITIFDTTGMAIQDNVMAEIIYKKALENGLGTYFEFVKDLR